MPIPLKDPLAGALVPGAAQRQHVIAIGQIPPGARAFEAHMADKLIGRLNPSTAQGIASFALGAVVDTVPVVLQVTAEVFDLGGNRVGRRAQPSNDQVFNNFAIT